ncbi:MAG: release factor glutamine methyltransferase [Solirubrobacteraceae bacterium]|nr:release factor glutamine methyltransferase [Solirubrobacteraceae bacterium]
MALRGTPVREAIASAVIAIEASGSLTPRLDAELLLADALEVDRAALLIDPDREVEGNAGRAFRDAVRRRSALREPVAYILGRQAFRYIELQVDPRVLIPRPETELLVEAALDLPEGARVVDVGAGSGAVALALKHERPDLHVSGTDASAEALEVARANGERLELEVEWAQGDLLDGLGSDWDAVLANLPYVAEPDRDSLGPEIVDHEPEVALIAGADGLGAIRRLIPAAAATRARLLALEIGMGQAPAVATLVAEGGFADVETRRDLAGIERVVVGRR